jgi:hypothetical protein
MRRLLFISLAVGTLSLVCTSSALAAVFTLTLRNNQAYKGFKATVSATYNTAAPRGNRVTVFVTYTKTKRISGPAPKARVPLGTGFIPDWILEQLGLDFDEVKDGAFAQPPPTLVEALLNLNLPAPKVAAGETVAGALGKWGSGRLHVDATGPAKTKTCSTGEIKTRPVAADSGQLTLSPSGKASDRFTRSNWTGTLVRTEGSCAGPPPPCTNYTTLSSSSFKPSGEATIFNVSRTGGNTGVTMTHFRAPASVSPASFGFHLKATEVRGSRFTNANDLSTAEVNLNGVPGWGGMLDYSKNSGPTTFPGACPFTATSGPATGEVRATFAFLGTKKQAGSPNAQLARRQV